jgi:proteic killer suppression protein
VIRSFRDKDTEAVWRRTYVKKLSPELSRLTYNKLFLINAAESINDLRVPPGNRLEKLVGTRAGQYSVRVNAPVARLLHLERRRRRKRRARRRPLEGRTPMADFAPTHPGEILMTEFLEPMGISQ